MVSNMAIPKKRLEELACQFLMMVEILCEENNADVCDNLRQLSNVTEEELLEFNFPMKYYKKKEEQHKLHEQKKG